MSHESDYTAHNQDNIRQKLPHPGDIPVEEGGERPVREFDNTPLDEAHRQGLIGDAPNTVHEGFGEGLTDEERQLIADRRAAAEQHSDKGSRKKGLIAVGAGVTALAVAAGGYFSLKGGDGNPQANQGKPAATASPNPGNSHDINPSGQTTTTSPEYSPEKPDMKLTNILDSEYYKTLTPEQQATIKKLHEMDVSTFRQQPADIQHMFSLAARNAYRGYTVKMIDDLLPNPVAGGDKLNLASEDATPKKIMESQILETTIPVMMLTRDKDPTKVYEANRPDAVKAMIGLYTNTSTSGAKETLNKLETMTELNGNMYYLHVKSAEQLDVSTSPSDVPEKVIRAHYTEVDDGLANITDQNYTIQYETFKGIKGNTIKEWLTASIDLPR